MLQCKAETCKILPIILHIATESRIIKSIGQFSTENLPVAPQ